MRDGDPKPQKARDALLFEHEQWETEWLSSEGEDRGYLDEREGSSRERGCDCTGEHECTLENVTEQDENGNM